MRRLSHLACAVGLLVAATPALADYKRSYATGLEAAQAGRWDEAEARMKEALAEEATPKANVKLYGMRFETYVPQYYLALAAKNRGDCATAIKYYDMPGVEAVVQADNKLAGGGAGLKDCRSKQLANNTPPEKIEPKLPVPAPTPTPVPAAPEISAPTELVNAIDNYLGGRYAQAASVDPARLPDARARYHALLVRAAARFVQAQLQAGDAGKTLLSQAETDVRGAKQIQPNAAPDPTLFPPKFRQFYTATR